MEVTVKVTGKMPIVLELAEHLWGKECNFDSDGDANSPDDVHWRRLYLCRRVRNQETGFSESDENTRLEIFVASDDAVLLRIVSNNEGLLNQTLCYLVDRGSVEEWKP
ncbi:MAG: hypothetical protein MJH08_12795 [Hyphomicrobiales bacterium]|nr:hypothetical protein [Hyphomicrobiales bacterium]